uniref:Spliceosome-associated protein CWC27 homolog n=2 Tax=Tetraodon nigroviridis TaxID=99883 RepID=H3D7J6_TETNG
MSNIYIQEPPTNGKVLLKTTAGDIDIELWSKETPKACRNFVQLCMEGYYNGTIFHRVVQDFIIQGGDPTGTGTGGESIYGRPFRDEFHTRLRFIRRGLVAMANAGPHDNGSQFFFTLGRADELNNKHTIFGKVTGDTIYNLLRLAEVQCDSDERPLKPHKIRTTEVLHSPFDDIIPRELKKPKKEKEEEKKSQSKATKNFSLLSFGEEAEEDEEMVNQVSETLKGKSKSSHDLLKDDPRLSSVPAVKKKKGKKSGDAAGQPQRDRKSEFFFYLELDRILLPTSREAKTLQREFSARVTVAGSPRVDSVSLSLSSERKKEKRKLKRKWGVLKKKKIEGRALLTERRSQQPTRRTSTPSMQRARYPLARPKRKEALAHCRSLPGVWPRHSRSAVITPAAFKLSAGAASTVTSNTARHTRHVQHAADKMGHVLQFDEQSRKVKDATMHDEDTFEIYDPRNPVNKRRREESKKILKEKKAKR